ncbi:hypothetical protein OYC64_012839 [Pagothenia borchgrevinki]|uniref:Mixed lineage kinase domain-containing protein n=1 Tax=Pagothenia borchgrevinki TaxID=8213 RepID=A0ABD2FRP3_PAGBO
MDVVGYVTPILDLILALNNRIGVIESNSQQFSRISARLGKLEKLVESIQGMGQIKNSADVSKALNNLQQALTEAKNKIEKYQNLKPLLKILRSSHYETKFKDVNERLSDANEELSGSLHVRQNNIQEKLKEEQDRKLEYLEEELDRKLEGKKCIIL